MKKLIQELKRRNVFKETIAYLVVAWLVLQVFAIVLPIWNAPNWILQIITISLALGLPLWIAFSWHYQFSSSGIRKTKNLSTQKKSSKLNRILNTTIIIALLVVICLIWINPSLVTVKPTDKLSIAILPFSNTREDPDSDFLGVALVDEIIGELSYAKDILVRPSSAVRKYADKIVDAPTAGTELNVNYVLVGNYLIEGDVIRMNFELVDVQSNELVWGEKIEADYQNAFQMQDIVSEKVLNGLKLQFSDEESQLRKIDISEDPLAYEYYLRALAQPGTPQGNQMAINLLNKSVELDSLFAPIWSELGWRVKQLGAFNIGEGHQIEDAEQLLQKALNLNSELPSALANLAAIYVETGRTEKAIETARHVLSINPNSAENHYVLGYAYRYAGFLEEEEKEQEIALSIDNNNPRLRAVRSMTKIYQGKLNEALEILEFNNEIPYFLAWQGQVHLRLNNDERALELFNKVIEMDQQGVGKWVSSMKYHLEGKPELGRQALEILEINLVDAEQYYNLANLYGLLGYKADCIRTLRETVNRGFFCYPVFENDKFLDSVRSEPGFQEILEEVKTIHEEFGRQYF
jgi:TolB-like protein/Tfp pilus assembly protein PilF